MHSSLNLKSSTELTKEEFRKVNVKINIGKDKKTQIKIIHTCLFDSNDSYDFREALDWKNMGLLDYPKKIKYPMDLSTVGKKLKEMRYQTVEHALDEIQLIWDNCKVYNPSNSWIYTVAESLQRSFRKMLRNYFPELEIPMPPPLVINNDTHKPFEEDEEDVTYHQKLKFSEELSFLSEHHLQQIILQIIQKCPSAYRQLDNDRAQILVDNFNLSDFHWVSLLAKKLKKNIIDNQ